MKNCFIYFLFIIFISENLKSQNLVPNPSFEIYISCPTDMTIFSARKLIPDWNLPTRGTSDYFNACSKLQVGIPQNFIGNLYAFDGNAYAGIVLIEKPPINDSIESKVINYREYLQTEIVETLQKGKAYCISVHYAIANYSTYSTNSLGVCLTSKKNRNRLSSKVLKCKPVLTVPYDTIYAERNYWYTLTDTIIANGNEKYLTIGNFYDDHKTLYKTLDISNLNSALRTRIQQNKIAYYYIDMVLVELINYK
ncbi:MAG: hypothetical protein A2041_08570 [Bacteroidetes bacterium GWA2_31_9b]|nr:MAG: hypothetical protein A2041_08570 [Bacteroidetes bacterium GWA2_31_9b]